MNYIVNQIGISEISKIKEDWELLERGEDMTYFQSYHWNKMLISYTPQNKYIESGFFIVKDMLGITKLIAPLWIIKKTFRIVNHKGVYFIGRKGWSDYLNLIYSDFSKDAFIALKKFICIKYGVDNWIIEQLKESTQFYEYLSHTSYRYVNSTVCAALEMPSTIEQYLKLLSKNSKQNLRTARNRANTDHIVFEINTNNRNLNLNICKTIRYERVKKKNNKIPFLVRIKMFFRNLLAIKFPKFLPFYNDEESRFLTVFDKQSGELAAFFNYGYDKHHREIVVMAVGLNEKYSRYSPGIVGMSTFIHEAITNLTLLKIDFTRGDERYKFNLGAKEHLIYTVKLK